MKNELRVLLLEDSESDAELILRELHKSWDIVYNKRVYSGNDMRELLMSEQWDIIVSDYIMPQFTGMDALEILKESGLDIPFIMVSGIMGEEVAVAVIKAGARDYILKDNLPRLALIIERELAEKEIRNSQKQEQIIRDRLSRHLEAVFNTKSNIALYERKNREHYFTDNIKHLTGWSSIELAEDKSLFEDQVHFLDKPIIRKKYQKWSQEGKKGTLYLWYRITHRDGRIIWIEEQMHQPLTDDGKRITTGILIDNSELKTTERELRAKEKKIYSYIEHAPLGVFVTDKQGSYIEVNPAACAITGYTTAELLSMKIPDLLPQQAIATGIEHFQRLVTTGHADGENQFRHKSGEIRYWTVNAVRLSSTRFLGYVQDISERKQAEKKLIKTKAKLESTQRKMLQMETMAALGEFASGIAHEIRNPLANIYSSVQYIMKKFQPEAKMIVFLELINRNSENANFIIKELLEFARPRELLLEPTNILSVIANVCELTSAKRIDNNVELVIDYPAELALIAIDIELMKRAILNIIMNAIESMKNGGILTIKAETGGDIIEIHISDTDGGISKEDISKVFTPFFSRKSTGVGLGLSLTHRIIGSHLGNIEVKSQYNKGATFIIQLPIYKGNK